MKIRFYSDLHLEFGKFKAMPPADAKDTVLVLAGDIGVKLQAIPWIESIAQDYKAVIYVAGNHEFYNGNMQRTLGRLNNVAHIPNFHFLDNKAVVIDNYKFVGTTLWTDLKQGDWFVKQKVSKNMNDFYSIEVGDYQYSNRNKKYLNADLWIVLHKQAVQFIKEQLEEDNIQTIVVTHHAPCIQGTNHERYGLTDMTYAYYTPLEYLMDEYKHLTHWIFGHTHKTLDMDIYGTRVLSNPRGYVGHEVNPKFDPTWEIKL